MAGSYTAPSFGAPQKSAPKDNYRLLAAIVMTPDTGYFLRMIGPDKTVKAASAEFDKLIGTIEVGKGK